MARRNGGRLILSHGSLVSKRTGTAFADAGITGVQRRQGAWMLGSRVAERRSKHEKKFVLWAANRPCCKRLSLARCASDSCCSNVGLPELQCYKDRTKESRNIAIHGSFVDAAAGARE